MEINNCRVLVYDLGLFPELACRLARDFGKVWYFCPWAEHFRTQTRP